MKVRLLTRIRGEGMNYHPGATPDLPDKIANCLIGAGLAVSLERTVETETASAEPTGETAAVKHKKKKSKGVDHEEY